MMTIIVSIILAFLIFFLYKMPSGLEWEGRERQKYGAQTSKWLLQAIHGIKEIKILKLPTSKMGFTL